MKVTSSLLIIMFLLIGCQGETGPAGPSLKGNISGYVVLFDSLGKKISNRSGVLVSVEGTNYSAVSDSNGKWVLNDVSTGTYNINCTKAGFSPDKTIGYSFAGGGNAYFYERYLFNLPTYQVSDLFVGRSISEKYINIKCSATSNNSAMVAILFSKSADVSSKPGKFNFYMLGYTSVSGTSNLLDTYIYSSSLDYYNALPGDKIYIRIYSHAKGGSSSYTDPETGYLVVSSVGLSSTKVDSIIVP